MMRVAASHSRLRRALAEHVSDASRYVEVMLGC